jgi:hypothetical protein
MVASPKLSQWFYEYERRNRRLPDAELPAARRRSPAPKPARPRGFAPGSQPRKRLTVQQRQKLIDLLKEHPRSPSTVAKEFAEATGVTVSTVTVCATRKKAIKAGTLELV